jgi:hypothetical protein
MRNAQEIPWKRIIAEGTAIVISILLAFAIDAWWVEIQGQRGLRNDLVAVLEDFRYSKISVEKRRIYSVARQESILALLTAALGEHQNLKTQEIDVLLSDIGWFQSEVPVTTTAMNALISGGNIGSINSKKLRQNLTEWQSDFIWLQSQHQQDYDYMFDVWLPFMTLHGYLPQIANASKNFPGNPDSDFGIFPISPFDRIEHLELIKDKQFHNVLLRAWAVQYDVLYALDFADKKLDTSIELLEEELNR